MLVELVGVMKEINYLKNNKIKYYIARKYIQHRLKKDFFDKFNLNIPISYNMIQELLIIDSDYDYEAQYAIDIKNEVPIIDYHMVGLISYGAIEFHFKYYGYNITVRAYGKENHRWNIIMYTVNEEGEDLTISIHPTVGRLNLDNTLRQIILMSIYNYCVVYVYKEAAAKKYRNLMIEDKTFILKIRDIFREAGYIV